MDWGILLKIEGKSFQTWGQMYVTQYDQHNFLSKNVSYCGWFVTNHTFWDYRFLLFSDTPFDFTFSGLEKNQNLPWLLMLQLIDWFRLWNTFEIRERQTKRYIFDRVFKFEIALLKMFVTAEKITAKWLLLRTAFLH